MNQPVGHGWPARKQRLVSATIMLARQRAGRAESMMKSGTRWTDRTGHATQGLTAGVELGLAAQGASFGTFGVSGGGSTRLRRIILYLAHSMGYGKWLETHKGAAHGRRRFLSPDELARKEYAGKLAVIHPTARRIGPGYVISVKRIWNRSPA